MKIWWVKKIRDEDHFDKRWSVEDAKKKWSDDNSRTKRIWKLKDKNILISMILEIIND